MVCLSFFVMVSVDAYKSNWSILIKNPDLLMENMLIFKAF
jgi:hypothetical protein